MPVTTIEWVGQKIRMIDQTQLPLKLVYLDIDQVETLGEAIRNLRVRGAPAIGVAAAFGILLGIQHHADEDEQGFFQKLHETAEYLRRTRPTAVNLAWALDQMLAVAHAQKGKPVAEIKQALLQKAKDIYEQDRQTNRKLAAHGAALVPENAQIITHCNTGALATVDYGTALGVIFTAHAQGKKLHVWVDETRPLLQG
ncbi:MAG: S-methyl-5-thioribose-1-phosphate isomerase, partial [Calditrichaeota bacterium]